MSGLRAVLLVLVVVGGSLVTVAPANATPETNPDPAETQHVTAVEAQQTTPANETTNQSLGADISSFMQSNAAEVDGAVETGMWGASFDGTDNRSTRERLVERRTDELREDLTELQDRKQELISEREAGNVSKAAYKAQMGQLVGRINSLKAGINATETRAEEVGTNVDAIRALETEASELSGPEIAAVARNTSGLGNASGPPENAGNGVPVEDAGNGSGNGVSDSANETRASPPENAGNDNASDASNAVDGGELPDAADADELPDAADGGELPDAADDGGSELADESEPPGLDESANQTNNASAPNATAPNAGSPNTSAPNASTPGTTPMNDSVGNDDPAAETDGTTVGTPATAESTGYTAFTAAIGLSSVLPAYGLLAA